MGVPDEDSYDLTETEVAQTDAEKKEVSWYISISSFAHWKISSKKLKNNLPRFLEEKQKLIKKYPNLKKGTLSEPEREVVLSLSKIAFVLDWSHC